MQVCEKQTSHFSTISTRPSLSCDLERADSAEPLSPPVSNAQSAQPSSPPQGESHETSSSQPSPVDDDRDDDAAPSSVTDADADMIDTADIIETPPLPQLQSSSSAFMDTSAAAPEPPLPAPASYARINLKGQGLGEDELKRSNEEIRAAIEALRCLLDGHPMLEMRVAQTEVELLDALKLYRDMNHLSLTGVTCEQVVEHVLSHTINLYYRPSPDEPEIAVTAATFTMRQSTMMLRLLATHPRMTRKGFGRVTVHFLKELCRALHKSDILVYTYPSSAPFYKALNFRHTHTGETAKPSAAEAGADAAARESAREARRAFSAKENEMVFLVQPSMAQVISSACRAAEGNSTAHPYACTRRRASTGPGDEAASVPGSSSRLVHSASSVIEDVSISTNAAAAVGRSRRSSKKGTTAEKEPLAPPPAAAEASCKQPASAKRVAPRSKAAAAVTSADRASQAEAWVAAVAPVYTPEGGQSRSCGSSAVSAAAQAAKSILASVAAEVAATTDAAGEMGVAAAAVSTGVGTAELDCPRKRARNSKSKDVYEVEKILDVQRNTSDPADIKYLIKWKGYAAAQCALSAKFRARSTAS